MRRRALIRSTAPLQVLVIARHEPTGRQTMTTLCLKMAATLSVLVTLLAVVATADNYAWKLANWAHWQRIGWGYWVDGWRRCLSGPGWMADLRVMGRAMKGPWEWQVIYGQ